MAYYGLEHSYTKFSGKKLKSELSSFLPNLPGIIDAPGSQDNSSLRSVIEKPPIGGKELLPLTSAQLAGFRLHPGPVSIIHFTHNTLTAGESPCRRSRTIAYYRERPLVRRELGNWWNSNNICVKFSEINFMTF